MSLRKAIGKSRSQRRGYRQFDPVVGAGRLQRQASADAKKRQYSADPPPTGTGRKTRSSSRSESSRTGKAPTVTWEDPPYSGEDSSLTDDRSFQSPPVKKQTTAPVRRPDDAETRVGERGGKPCQTPHRYLLFVRGPLRWPPRLPPNHNRRVDRFEVDPTTLRGLWHQNGGYCDSDEARRERGHSFLKRGARLRSVVFEKMLDLFRRGKRY